MESGKPKGRRDFKDVVIRMDAVQGSQGRVTTDDTLSVTIGIITTTTNADSKNQ